MASFKNRLEQVQAEEEKTKASNTQFVNAIANSRQKSGVELLREMNAKKKKKSLFPKKKKKVIADDIPLEKESNLEEKELTYDEKLDLAEAKKTELKYKKIKNEETKEKIKKIGLIFCCLYLAFIIYGAIITTYTYDDNGYVVPQVMKMSDIKEKGEFEKVLYYYKECIELYEGCIDIDYELSLGKTSSSIIATEYEGKLEKVDALITQLSALSLKSNYSLLQQMLTNWASNDIAVYLQNISEAITTNNQTKASNALQDRVRMESDFNTITANFVEIGKSLVGVNTNEYADWTVEKYSEKISNK